MGAKAHAVNSEQLVISALRNAQFIKALADLPLIQETNVIEAAAEFDVRGFMESKFFRPSHPVGSTLTTGPTGPKRFREQDWNYSLGVRKRVATGGEFELSQQIGHLDNNSEFLDPKSQGNAKFKLSFSQPLLNGAGKAYNTSLIVLAEVDERVAWDKLSTQLQDYLLDVVRAYWELYLQRAVLQQKIRHFQRAQVILTELEDRREIDAAESQIARARAAVTSRRSEIIRAETAVRNAESQIRALVNAPDLVDSGQIELVPTEVPAHDLIAVSPRDALVSALENRPEIDEAIQQIRSAGVRLDVAENELKPVLDLVLETYVSGLRGSSDIGQALADQFTLGEPSYSAGLLFEMPLHNRAARARYLRRELEMRQLLSQFRGTVEGLMSEVEIAVREVETTYHEMQSRYQAMVANEIDMNSLTERWRLLPGDDRSASFVLEDILDAQDRLVAEELQFVSAQVSYTLSLARLNRALGVLLQTEQVDAYRAVQCGLPKLLLDKPEAEVDIVEENLPIDLPPPELVPFQEP